MTENAPLAEPTDDPVNELRAHAERLEQKLNDFQQQSDTRLIRAEMKAEAIRAGMIDLDGLKLLDLSAVRLNEKAEIDDASGLMARLKKGFFAVWNGLKRLQVGSLRSSLPASR